MDDRRNESLASLDAIGARVLRRHRRFLPVALRSSSRVDAFVSRLGAPVLNSLTKRWMEAAESEEPSRAHWLHSYRQTRDGDRHDSGAAAPLVSAMPTSASTVQAKSATEGGPLVKARRVAGAVPTIQPLETNQGSAPTRLASAESATRSHAEPIGQQPAQSRGPSAVGSQTLRVLRKRSEPRLADDESGAAAATRARDLPALSGSRDVAHRHAGIAAITRSGASSPQPTPLPPATVRLERVVQESAVSHPPAPLIAPIRARAYTRSVARARLAGLISRAADIPAASRVVPAIDNGSRPDHSTPAGANGRGRPSPINLRRSPQAVPPLAAAPTVVMGDVEQPLARAAGEGQDIEELVNRVCARLARQLSIEAERRGAPPWPWRS